MESTQNLWETARRSLLSRKLASAAGDDAQVGEAVDEILHCQGDQQKSHDADQDADAGFAHDLADAAGAGEDQIADQGCKGDGSRGLRPSPNATRQVPGRPAPLPRRWLRGRQAWECRGARFRLFLGRGLFGVARGFLCGGAAGFKHIEADEQQDQASGDFEGGQSDAEHLEDELTGDSKVVSTMKAGERALARHALAAGGSALSVMARNEGMAAKGSTRKKTELSASSEKRTMGAWLSWFKASAAGLVKLTF